MDVIILSRKMQRLTIWLEDNCQPESLIRRQSDDGYLIVDPSRQGDIASFNFNRVLLCGREAGMDGASVARWIDLFRQHGVSKFFVWLSPGPEMEIVRGWLRSAGLSRVPWVRYPTLVRDISGPLPFETDLVVRQVTPDEIAAACQTLGETMWPGYLRSAGKDDFFHYMAFDIMRPVATAALAVFDGMAYLLSASTAEADRKRGAQQALIAARLARAKQLGCAIQISETLNILEHSLRNLQRAGFREVYEKQVYGWSDPHDEGREARVEP